MKSFANHKSKLKMPIFLSLPNIKFNHNKQVIFQPQNSSFNKVKLQTIFCHISITPCKLTLKQHAINHISSLTIPTTALTIYLK